METILTTLLVMGLQASILAIIIIAFRGIFKKIPRIYIYVLWLVMLVRLMVPVIFESDYGVTPSPDRIIISATNEGIVLPNTNINTNTTTNPALDSDMNQADVDNNNLITNNEGTQNNNQVNGNNTAINKPDNVVNSEPSKNQTTLITPDIKFWQQSWFLPVVCTVWAVGAVAVLLVTAMEYFSMKRKLQFAIRISGNIWECENVTSPFVMGFINPRIYLPIRLPEDEKEYILLHEQMHIKHFDHVTRFFMTLATAIHWWNPIVWASMNLMKKDMEMVCDESTTKAKEPGYRKAYSMVLVKYAAKNSGLSPVLSFGESNTERRVKHLMFLKKPKFYVNIAMVFVMCFCLMSCVANGPADNTEMDTEADTEKPSYIPEEPVTLTLYSDMSSYEGIQKGWFADVLLEKFNVILDIKMSSTEPDENQYTGDYDIIICGSKSNEHFLEAVEEGHILDLSNHNMDTYMPYISEHLTDSFVRFPEFSDDATYGISGVTSNPGDHNQSYISWSLRFDYYEELGKPVISDIEDWVNVLEQMQELHPFTEDGRPIYATDASYVTTSSDGQMFEVSHLVQGYYGYDTIGMGFYDWKNGQYYDLLAMDENGSYGPYLTMLKVYNDLYQKGLLYLDPNPGEGTIDEMNMLENGQFLTYMMYTATEYMYPVIPEEATQLTYQLGTTFHRIFSIDSETKYPELTMAVLDYFYSPEGMLTMTYGPEGECWYYDEDGYTCITELGLSCYYDRDATLSDGSSFTSGMPMFNLIAYAHMATNTNNGEPFDFLFWKNTVTEPVNDVESAWREWSGSDSVDKYMYSLENYYNVPVLDTYYENLTSSFDNVSRLIIDKCWEAIQAPTDAEFDAIVQDMITEATQAGYEECVEDAKNYIQEHIEKSN